jgi:hypothetical protein
MNAVTGRILKIVKKKIESNEKEEKKCHGKLNKVINILILLSKIELISLDICFDI